MSIYFIADLDSRTWIRHGEFQENDFEVHLCMYVPYKTKIKNFHQNFELRPFSYVESLEFEEAEFFVTEDPDLPEFSARIFNSYRIKNLVSDKEYEIRFSISNLRKEFSDFFRFKTN